MALLRHLSQLRFIRHPTKLESEIESVSCSVVSDSFRPHGLQPTRLLCPWDFPGKSTGVCWHFLLQGSSQPRDRTWVSCIEASVCLWCPSSLGGQKPTLLLPELSFVVSPGPLWNAISRDAVGTSGSPGLLFSPEPSLPDNRGLLRVCLVPRLALGEVALLLGSLIFLSQGLLGTSS